MDCNCKSLTDKLRKVDFSIIDTALYLDSYPDCQKALAYYNKLMCERDTIRRALAEKCRRPMTSFENVGDSWDWIASPWPWDPSAN
jgi:spore coat protein JB